MPENTTAVRLRKVRHGVVVDRLRGTLNVRLTQGDR